MTKRCENRSHTHLGTYGFVTRNDAVLLVLKSRGPYRGCWDLPGGRIEFGESSETALARELWEETGFQMADLPVLIAADSHSLIWSPEEGTREELHHLGFIYRITVDAEQRIPTVIEKKEDAMAVEWKAFRSLARLPLTPFARKILQPYLPEEMRQGEIIDPVAAL